MMRYVKLYKKFLIQYLKSLMEYKVDFFFGLFGFFLIQASGIAFINLVFSNIPTLNGWSYYDMLFIYGFAQLPRGIDHLIMDNIWIFARDMVIQGTFDRYLVRPINPFFQMISERFQPDAFGEIIVGIVILAISVPKINISISIINILIFVILVFAGSVIYTSIKLFFASFAFWIKNSINLVFMVYNISTFAKYPMSIYPKAISIVVQFMVPFAFTAFVPAEYMLGKVSFVYGVGGTILCAGVAWILAYGLWTRGIKSYESSGS
ncbi:ABC-2 family transporter protein [Clostridium sp. YIM B02505]|uniref:ABC-2 family transporter protein n=2 Tax=Clostridium yunnanense TaxID=2800325 RepID=A0ABS1EWZ3_9CLOT|nr:ABC-2 family transporter protein [Clostridium yunnanense]